MSSARFVKELQSFVLLCKAREAMLFRRVDAHVGRSIKYGSPVTGAPGQPVKSGDLLRSWQRFGSAEQRFIEWLSELFYAPIIEDNWRGATLRSSVGGFHSVKLTRASFKLIVAYELAIVKRAIPDNRGVGSSMRDPITGRFT